MPATPVQDGTNLASPREPTQCVVNGAHAFILRISSFFGLAPLRFVSHPKGFMVSLSKPMCLYSYILVTVLIICIVLSIAGLILEREAQSMDLYMKTMLIVHTGNVILITTSVSIGVYCAPKRMKKMLKFMETITDADKNIGSLYLYKSELMLNAIVICILIIPLIPITIEFYFISLKQLHIQWSAISYYVGFIAWYMSVVLELQFMVIVLTVRTRIAAINDALTVTAQHVGVIVFGEPSLAVSPCESVLRLASLYNALCDVIHQVIDSYGFSLAVMLTTIFISLIVTPYLFLTKIVTTNQLNLYITQSVWGILHIIRMFLMVEPCHHVISDIAGAVTTYLVILLQFSMN